MVPSHRAMPASLQPPPSVPPAAFTRALAALLAALIFALGLFSASPDAHAWLHAHAAAHAHEAGDPHTHDDPTAVASDDTGCAILLYAQGLLVATPLSLPSTPQTHEAARSFFASEQPLPVAASHQHPPGCGPPARG